MRFWWIASLSYAAALLAGLLLPAGTILVRQGSWTNLIVFYGLTAVAMGIAAFLLTLMSSRILFPQYWWIGQVLGEDVYELHGVYFVGVRLSRVPSRLQRLIFGANEKFRRWDLAFGLVWLVLVIGHGLGAMTSHRMLELYLPKPVRLPETLHAALLTDLPALRELHRPWKSDPDLMLDLQERADRLQALRGKTETDWFRLAQFQLARAYKVRKGPNDAYRFSPMDRVFFERGIGAQAADDLMQVLSVPEAKRAPLTRGALTLLGFFYLSEYNYPKAEQILAEALAKEKAPDESGIPLHWTRMLAAQVALQRSEAEQAGTLLAAVLADPALPKPLEALAVEHLAEARRIAGASREVGPLLDRADRLYADAGDAGGRARIHLRRAVFLADGGKADQASEELSLASMQAETANDVFVLNMVVRATHLLPALH